MVTYGGIGEREAAELLIDLADDPEKDIGLWVAINDDSRTGDMSKVVVIDRRSVAALIAHLQAIYADLLAIEAKAPASC